MGQTYAKRRSKLKSILYGLGAFSLTLTGFVGVADAARADAPDPPVAGEFNAPTCLGGTLFDPVDNAGMAVPDTSLIFGERLTSYNEGRIVPLYDAFGGSVLISADGTNTGEAAYPPLCGTRYESSVGGPVSEWMFCTDRHAMSCGDTNELGQLVDDNGDVVNPMNPLPTNAKLSADQEKLIAYLIQHGHDYVGTGDQEFNNASTATAHGDSWERAALQTLVWCISDPATDGSDFAAACATNLPDAEQQRLLQLIPDVPELLLDLDATTGTLYVGGTAQFEVTTNIYNQPIELTLGGTAAAAWEVCEGDAILNGSTLTVNGVNPAASSTIALCVTGSAIGTAEIAASAIPPSTEYVEWSQGMPSNPDVSCQVYATFHSVNQVELSAAASAEFVAAEEPVEPEKHVTPQEPEEPAAEKKPESKTPTPTATAVTKTALAKTGSDPVAPLFVAGAAVLLVLGGSVLLLAKRRRSNVTNATQE